MALSVCCLRTQADFQADLDFVRAACITTEVNMARVFNHDVKIRREVRGYGGTTSWCVAVAS